MGHVPFVHLLIVYKYLACSAYTQNPIIIFYVHRDGDQFCFSLIWHACYRFLTYIHLRQDGCHILHRLRGIDSQYLHTLYKDLRFHAIFKTQLSIESFLVRCFNSWKNGMLLNNSTFQKTKLSFYWTTSHFTSIIWHIFQVKPIKHRTLWCFPSGIDWSMNPY